MGEDFITFVIVEQHNCIVMLTSVKTIAERLKHARSVKGWSQGQLATSAGLSQGTIGNIESGARQAHASLISIAEALGVNYKWLVSGEGSAHMASETQAVYLVGNPQYPSIRRVQLHLQAGVTGFTVENDPEDAEPIVFRKDWFTRHGYQPSKMIAITVKGDSMEPGLFAGDTIVINTAQTEPKDGAVFAINYEGEPVVKRMVRDGGQWWLASDNQDQARHPRKIANGTAIIIGQVVHRQSERI